MATSAELCANKTFQRKASQFNKDLGIKIYISSQNRAPEIYTPYILSAVSPLCVCDNIRCCRSRGHKESPSPGPPQRPQAGARDTAGWEILRKQDEVF